MKRESDSKYAAWPLLMAFAFIFASATILIIAWAFGFLAGEKFAVVMSALFIVTFVFIAFYKLWRDMIW